MTFLDNPCTLHHFGEITPANLRPYSKNPTLCKFMIQLGRFDQLGFGVTNINKYLPFYANGAKPVFNETRHGFELTIPLVDEAAVKAGSGPSQAQVTGEVTGEVRRLLSAMNGEMKRAEIQSVRGLKHEDYFREAYLLPAIKLGLLEMTIPDKPRSSRQKYRLTTKGKQLRETL
jgi:ATP-dependent DNA helicase RecG